MDKLKELIEIKIRHYNEILARAKIQLIAAKKIEDPKERILRGIEDLPSIKERVLMGRKMVDDLNEMKKLLESNGN